MKDIKKTTQQYALQVLTLASVMMIITNIVQYLGIFHTSLLGPTAVAYTFYLATAAAFCIVWQRVASRNPEMLTTVYMATSGFRMIIALFTLLGVYIATGRDKMLPYAIVFMIYYLVAVGHHSIFFARVTNKM